MTKLSGREKADQGWETTFDSSMVFTQTEISVQTEELGQKRWLYSTS